jgi:serine/threonine protein kinase
MVEQPEPASPPTLPVLPVEPLTEMFSAEKGTDESAPASTIPMAGSAPVSRLEAAKPRTFGDYELLGEIGSGGMGIVYRAREVHSGRLVALKMMQGTQGGGSSDLQRFILEARATGQLNHPGIVAIHAWGEHESHPFYTMDFVPGQPLSRLLEKGQLPSERAVRYMCGIARAVAVAHAIGIVHRDLKPSNIIIDASDQPRILDFGLAKRQSPDLPEKVVKTEPIEVFPIDESGHAASPTNRKEPRPLTEKGAILGTPAYMAPEQVRAEHDKVGPPADVHALGAIFHEMLTGTPPFRGASNFDILMKVLNARPPSVRSTNPRVPLTLEKLCRRCLAKATEDRYPDAGALADDLEDRWHRFTQAKRYARLTLWATMVVLLLCAVQLVIAAFPILDPLALTQRLAETATREGMLRQTATLLTELAQALALTLTPLAAGVAGLTWLAAWICYSERSGPLCVRWITGAAVGLGLWFVADLPFADPGKAAFAWLTLAVPVVVLGALIVKRVGAGKAVAASHARGTESYLQRLLGTRTNLQAMASVADGHRPAGLEDFEPGKEMHSWENGRISWGRQPSLDRPVLIWMYQPAPGSDTAGMGVMVRHSSVLNLHAVGEGQEGRYLVTEAAAATPLAALLQRGPLMPVEAVTLTIRLAEALQAFHDQGACHGRLGPDWVLVRGELEPVMCPCGVASLSPADQAEDVRALGRLLGEWLPQRKRAWSLRPQAALYRVCDAANTGEYDKAADVAEDLEKAMRLGRLRRRMRWASAVAVVLLVVPLLILAGLWLTRGDESLPTPDQAPNAFDRHTVITGLLVALCPSILVVGFSQVRFWIQRRRLRLSRVTRGRLGTGGTLESLAPLTLIFILGMALGILAARETEGSEHFMGTLLLALAELAGFWFLGAALAGLSIGVDILLRSLPGGLLHQEQALSMGTTQENRNVA